MAGDKKCPPFTDEHIEQIEAYASAGLSESQMAALLDMSRSTLDERAKKDDRVHRAIERGRSKAIFNVAKSAYAQAISGKTPAMTMFYLKCRAGWKETQVVEHAGKLETTPDQDTGAKLDRLMNILQELKKPDES